MYKLIIVEDEMFIRNGLTKMLNWQDLGFDLLTSFSCGNEAITFINRNDVDVILSDIKMENGTGLDLARYVYEQGLPIKIVFLSAHDGFSLAQEAIKYGVEKYLLKPLSIPDIRETFADIKSKLDKQTFLEEMLVFRSNSYQSLINYEIEKSLEILYSANIYSPEQRDNTLKFLSKHIHNISSLKLLLCEIEIENDKQYIQMSSNCQNQELEDQILHILSSFEDNLSYYSMNMSNYKYIGFFLEKNSDLKNSSKYISLSKNLPIAIKTLTNLNAKVNKVEQFENVYAYVNTYNGFFGNVSDSESIEEQKEKTLSLLISMQNNEQTWSEFMDFSLPLSLDSTYQHILHIAHRYITHLYENEKSESIALSNSDMSSLFSIKNKDAIIKWCIEKFNYLREVALENRYTDTISKIEKFIHDNYNQNLSLTDIAEQFYFNPVYLSRKFKQETGKNFTDYLAELRVKEAKKYILNSNKKIKDICELVGYSNIKYFYRVFKGVTGNCCYNRF